MRLERSANFERTSMARTHTSEWSSEIKRKHEMFIIIDSSLMDEM